MNEQEQREQDMRDARIPPKFPALMNVGAAVEVRDATREQIQQARDLYMSDDTEIDDDARISVADDGVWVSAWVWLADEREDSDSDSDKARGTQPPRNFTNPTHNYYTADKVPFDCCICGANWDTCPHVIMPNDCQTAEDHQKLVELARQRNIKAQREFAAEEGMAH